MIASPSRRAVRWRAALWLAFLAPFFYASYGFANHLAATRDGVGSIVFGWEHAIPFLPWTIVPYWSINLFYALSLFINETKSGVDRLAGRYLTAQLVAVFCFLLFPLAATFVRPATDGLLGFMFAVLGGFDKPFNQAPSLHIALLVIIWDHLRRRIGPKPRLLWHVWCALIGISVLTTWQHHFIDLPTGALLGLFALWLFPENKPLPFAGFRFTADLKARKLAFAYGGGAALCLAGAGAGAFVASPLWLILLWPALVLAITAFGYAGAGAKVFQKGSDGRASLAARWLLLPVRIGARVNAWAWTRNLPPAVPIADGVYLGRLPSRREAERFGAVIDFAAELERPARVRARWMAVPMLDLVGPEPDALEAAVRAIEEAIAEDRPVLVACALGFQRSAGATALWLERSGRAADATAARAMLAAAGRRVVLAPALSERRLEPQAS